MKYQRNEDESFYQKITDAVKANDGYCPCMVFRNEQTKCMCEDFKTKTQVGELCHCGRFRKLEM